MSLPSSPSCFSSFEKSRMKCAFVSVGFQRSSKPLVTLPNQVLTAGAPKRKLCAAISASLRHQELSTYRFARQPAAETEWFNRAVRDIVKNVDSTPFLHLVQIGDTASRGVPKFTTIPVADSVVTVPELWSGIAQHMASDQHSDVVILVQQVNAHSSQPSAPSAAKEVEYTRSAKRSYSSDTRMESGPQDDAPAQEGIVDVLPATSRTAQQAQQSASSAARASSSRSNVAAQQSESRQRSERIMQRVEAACRRLMQSGIADSLLMGKVGDCCETLGYHLPGDKAHQHHHGHHSHTASSSASEEKADLSTPLGSSQQQQQQQQQQQGSIVPFLGSPSPRRRAVQVSAIPTSLPPPSPPSSAALRPTPCTRNVCYYGLVVQSALGTGVEGCYLLKTVRNTTPTGCSCTHFSLVRVCQGEHLEEQFVQSWLV